MLDSENVYLFEEHSSTLPVWWSRKIESRTVVYLDAHLDLQRTSSESLAALKACDDIESVRRLEAPHHLNPSSRYAYGIENFLYAAHELGLIGRLVWVSPPHIPRRYSPGLLGYMQQMDGLEFSELTGFRELGGNALRGSLLGLDITICDFDELDSVGIGDDYCLDIDIDYFVEVPSDQLWIDPLEVLEAITARLGAPRLATISRAVGSGFTPTAFRFVGDYIHSYLLGRDRQIEYFGQLCGAVLDLQRQARNDVMKTCEQLIREQPQLPAAYYISALCTADAELKKRLVRESCRRDAGYCFDLAREAIGLLHRRKNPDPGVIRHLLTTLERIELQYPRREQAEIALAWLLAASGDIETSRSLVEKQTGEYADHDDVLLLIASAQLNDPEKYPDNKRILELVGKSEKNATSALLYLGNLEFESQNYAGARDFYTRAHERAPAWLLPLEQMAECHRRLGLTGEAERIENELERRRYTLDKLVVHPARNRH
jgi:tetratricopeptide (TPR) repeat protein